MYIIIKNDTEKAIIMGEKQMTADYLNCHRHTLTNNLALTNPWRREKETVYYTTEVYNSNKKGNKDTMRVKQGKASGEIECNKPKKKPKKG